MVGRANAVVIVVTIAVVVSKPEGSAGIHFLAVVMCIQQAGFHCRFSNCTQGRTLLAVVLGSKSGVKFSIPQQLPDRVSFSVLQKKTSMSMKILLL